VENSINFFSNRQLLQIFLVIIKNILW